MSDPFIPRSIEDLAVSWPKELDHFSASSAKMAVRCPEQWRQRYVRGIKTPPALAMVLGRADHAAIEQSMRDKITSWEDWPVKDVVDYFHTALDEDIERNGGLEEIEVPDADGKAAKVKVLDKERFVRSKIVEVYHRDTSPTVQPVAVEEEFAIQVPELPVHVIGYLDLVVVDADLGGNGEYIVDRKYGKRLRSKVEPEWGIQAEIYQLHRPVDHVWHLSAPGGQGQLRQACPSRERSERMLQHIVGTIGFYYQKYGPDEPWPTTGKLHPWACGYCGYRETCWGWA